MSPFGMGRFYFKEGAREKKQYVLCHININKVCCVSLNKKMFCQKADFCTRQLKGCLRQGHQYFHDLPPGALSNGRKCFI